MRYYCTIPNHFRSYIRCTTFTVYICSSYVFTCMETPFQFDRSLAIRAWGLGLSVIIPLFSRDRSKNSLKADACSYSCTSILLFGVLLLFPYRDCKSHSYIVKNDRYSLRNGWRRICKIVIAKRIEKYYRTNL